MSSFKPIFQYPTARYLAAIHLGLMLILCGCSSEKKESAGTGPDKSQVDLEAQKQKKLEREKELASARLDEKKQEFIFDSEHVTFLLEHVVGDRWKKAFKETDAAALQSLFIEEFSGETLAKGSFQTRKASVVTERIRQSGGSDNPADSTTLVEYLVDLRKSFSKLDRIKFRVLSISQPVPGQEVWECRILVDAVGESAPGRPKQYESEQVVVFEIGSESELETAPSISEWKIEKEIFRDADRYLTREVTDESLLKDIKLADNWEIDVKFTEQYWMQYSVEDFDRDGKMDIAVACNMFFPVLLYNAKGHRFIDVTDERNMISSGGKARLGSSFGCAWIDINNDGYPDLINGLSLYENQEGKSFRDIYSKSGLTFYTECMGIIIADYDCDGLLDIYALYQSPPVESGTDAPKQWVNETLTGAENQLWKNMGNGKFVNVTRQANAGGGKRHTHAAAWFFYDDDHYPDLYIANDFGKNVLLRNRGDGTFEDVSAETRTEGYSTSMGVVTGDLNNDGRSEIYVANMYSKMGRRIIGQVSESDYPEGIYEQIKGSCAGNRLYTRNEGKSFKEIGEKISIHDVGWAFGPAFADMDRDGLLDIYATTGFMSFDRTKPDG